MDMATRLIADGKGYVVRAALEHLQTARVSLLEDAALEEFVAILRAYDNHTEDWTL